MTVPFFLPEGDRAAAIQQDGQSPVDENAEAVGGELLPGGQVRGGRHITLLGTDRNHGKKQRGKDEETFHIPKIRNFCRNTLIAGQAVFPLHFCRIMVIFAETYNP